METVKEYVDNAAITTAVKAKLAAGSLLSALDIHVETNKGEVTLSGKVPSSTASDKAKEITRSYSGVKNIITDFSIER